MNEKQDNWSHIRETVLIINVAVARIEHAMVEGNDSVSSLSQSFVDMVSAAQQITRDAEALEDSPAKSKIEKNCLEISQRVQSTVIAFQFYDRLSQRMGHVSRTLAALTELLDDKEKPHSPAAWKELQDTIRSQYTLDSDQAMFNDVLNGMPIEQALEKALNSVNEEEVEFF